MGKDLNGKELGKGITQRKDGRYQGRFVNRFGKREMVYGKTLKEVKNELTKAMQNDISKSNVISPSITLDEWEHKWMEVYKKPYIRENTKIYYEQVYNSKISPVLGKFKLSSITKFQISTLFNNLKQEGYQWETLNKTKRLLVDIFNMALEDEFVTKNPAKSARLPINKPSFNPKALSKEDQNDFFTCANGTFYYYAFVVAVNTGLRPGELFALTKDDLDFDKKIIHVTKTFVYQKYEDDSKKTFHIEDPKTLQSIRDVPMNKTCEDALKKQLKRNQIIANKYHNYTGRTVDGKNLCKKLNLVFQTKYETPINTQIYNQAIDRIVDEVNLGRDELDYITDMSGHVFRHTFATRCFEAGIPPKTVQAYLGHASLKMTMDLYTKVMPEKKQDDMKLFEEYMDAIKQEDTKIIPFTA